MKVQFLNSSSLKTRELIKKAFAELLNEKKHLDKVTVTELVKKANITRSTFYTHYDNIYDVAQDYQLQTIVQQKLFQALKTNSTNEYLELDISFFMNGIMLELLNYFRDKSDYSLDELLINIQRWFERIF